MVKNKIMKKFLGTANYMARLTFYPNRKHYSAAMKVKIEIFDGRNLDGDFDCTNIAEVAEKVMKFYSEKAGHDIEIRRLARWFIEYLEDAEVTVPEMSTLIKDFQSTPTEIMSREGISTDPEFKTAKVAEAVEEVAEEVTEEIAEEMTEEPADEFMTDPVKLSEE